MRIAYLTQSYPPMISGAAFSAQQIAEAMAGRGHQVLVIAASDREHPYHTHKVNISILRLRSFNNPLRVNQRLIAHPRRLTMEALRQFRPDVIHAHEPVQMGMLALEYTKRASIPVTLTAHQLPWFIASYLPESLKPFVERTLWTVARRMLGNYTSVIAPTQTISTIIKQMTGIQASVISYGLDLGAFHPPLSPDDATATRTRLNLPAYVPVLLHVGRLDTDKRVDKVIRAAVQPIRESEAHLLIVGDGCQKNSLIRLCRKLGIEGRVHFAGYISPQDGLPEIYQACNVFVTASEIETQGIVLLEAAASGLPIVAVNATCIPEIVHDGVNGFLSGSTDRDGLSHAMSLLVRDGNKATQMGRTSRTLAERHELRFTIDAHEQLYRQLIQQERMERFTFLSLAPRRWWTRVTAWMSLIK